MRYWLLLALLWGTCLPVLASERVIEVSQQNPVHRQSIIAHAEVFEDVSKQLTLQQIKEKQSQFTSLTEQVFNGGYSRSSFWFHFSVRNSSSETIHRHIRLAYPLIDEWIVYESKNGQIIETKMGRYHEGDGERDRVEKVSIQLSPNQQADYWIKVESKDSLVVPLQLLTEKGLRQSQTREFGWISFYYGLVISMVIFSLFLYVTIRERIYIYYLMMVVTHHVIFFLFLNGMVASLFDLQNIWWSREALTFFVSASMAVFINFGRAFFRTKYFHPTMHKILNLNLVLSLIGMVLCFTVDHFYAMTFANISAATTGTMMYLLGIAALRVGNSSAKYYLYAWTIVIFGGITYSLKTWGLLPSNFITEYAWQAGAGIESVLLSMAIADRINRESRKRERAQSELVQTQKDINENLDRIVRERTEALEHANKKLQEISTTDGLTGLRNRRFFDETFNSEFKRAFREKSSLGLLLMDIDHFKNLNDTYGHQFGDLCLQKAAQLIQNSVRRPGDLSARYGGEEFVVLLPATDPNGVESIGASILKAFNEKEIEGQDNSVKVTVSIGAISIIPKQGDTTDNMLKKADELLYQAKENGRNRMEKEFVSG